MTDEQIIELHRAKLDDWKRTVTGTHWAVHFARAVIAAHEQARGQPEDERAAFEKWAPREGIHIERWPSPGANSYANSRTIDYWHGWQARAALAGAGESK